jgi:hypothetical protein
MGSALVEIIIDCREPLRVGRFWAEVLDWRMTEDDDATAGCRPTESPPPGPCSCS